MKSSANAPADARQAITVRLNVHDALFASGRQPSDAPTAGSVTESISRAVRRFGTRGCAGRRAQEFGDHPEVAAGRMRWARQFAVGAAARRPASRATAAWPAPQLAAREATTQPADAAEMNETCDRRGELDLGRHCTSRLRAALCAQGRTIWPVVRARRALQARHGLPLRCPANCPEDNPLTDEGT